MKEIKFRIPTSFSDVRQILKEKTSRRLTHNQAVLKEFAQEVSKMAYKRYWRNDISEQMKSSVFDLYAPSKLKRQLIESLGKLK